MGERGIVVHDWASRLRQLQANFVELRLNFPFDHDEVAVREVGHFIKKRESFYINEQAKSGLTFDYFEAIEILRLLTETTKEGSQKFFFGGFKSQIVDDWQSLIKQYELDGISMAEHARNLQHALNFAQPSLKNGILRLRSKVADGQQQQEILQSKVRELDKKINSDCEKLGINTTFSEQFNEKLNVQIRACVSQLMPIFNDIVQLTQKIESCAQYYLLLSGTKCDEIDLNTELGTLRVIAKYGDLAQSVYIAIKNGEIRTKDEKSSILELIQNTSLETKEIHKYDSYKQGLSKADESWEIIQKEQFKATDVGQSQVDISIADQTPEDTILLCSETRALLLDDLCELECFLQQRLAELQMPDSQLRCEIESNDETFIVLRSECENQTKIKAKIKTIKEIKSKLEDAHALQLITIKKNPQTVEKLAQELIKQQKLKIRYEKCLQDLETDLAIFKSELTAQKTSLNLWEEKIARLIAQITQDLNKSLKTADCHIKI